LATTLTLAGACADTILALLLFVRRWAQQALIGMVALAFVYLLLGTMMLPGLWFDPLAPFAKVLPTMVLALLLHPLLDRR
jgi:ABC-type arginine/histidine transport system permease subunit